MRGNEGAPSLLRQLADIQVRYRNAHRCLDRSHTSMATRQFQSSLERLDEDRSPRATAAYDSAAQAAPATEPHVAWVLARGPPRCSIIAGSPGSFSRSGRITLAPRLDAHGASVGHDDRTVDVLAEPPRGG